MSVGLKQYAKEAFNARPAGMFVPPNWIGVAAFGLLGLLNPGLWIVGAGLELGYLFVLVTNARFQNFVRGKVAARTQKAEEGKLETLVSRLEPLDKKLYATLEARCQAILQKQDGTVSEPDIQLQREGLGRLLWIYIRLLLTRRSIQKVLENAGPAAGKAGSLEERAKVLEEQLKDTTLPDELRRSLTSQAEILQQRILGQKEARTKKDVVEAELTRIAEQVELLRDQVMLAADPAVVSQRIDQIAATLGGTTQWIKEQQQIYGKVGDLLEEPPPLPLRKGLKEGQ
jgi:hypothetical protein